MESSIGEGCLRSHGGQRRATAKRADRFSAAQSTSQSTVAARHSQPACRWRVRVASEQTVTAQLNITDGHRRWREPAAPDGGEKGARRGDRAHCRSDSASTLRQPGQLQVTINHAPTPLAPMLSPPPPPLPVPRPLSAGACSGQPAVTERAGSKVPSVDTQTSLVSSSDGVVTADAILPPTHAVAISAVPPIATLGDPSGPKGGGCYHCSRVVSHELDRRGA